MNRPDERRTLHLIAILKIAKGLVLLFIAISFLFLDQRSSIVSGIIDWLDEELLLMHSKVFIWLLNRLEVMLLQTNFVLNGLVALGYSALLLTEGIGVWKQKRWAEWLMVVGTSSLIPLEIYHFSHRATILKFCVIVINVLIVVYLIATLRRHRTHSSPQDQH